MLLRLLTYTYVGMAGAVIFFGKGPEASEANLATYAPIEEAEIADTLSTRSATSPVSVALLAEARSLSSDETLDLIKAAVPVSATMPESNYVKGTLVEFRSEKPSDTKFAAADAPADMRRGVVKAERAEMLNLVYVTGSRVNLRAGPGTNSAVVTSLVRGSAAEAIGVETDGWQMIRDAETGIEGYMATRFLAAKQP